jgi:hypothetical protein
MLRGAFEGFPPGLIALEADPRTAARDVLDQDGIGGVGQTLLVAHFHDRMGRDHAGAVRTLRSRQLFLHDIARGAVGGAARPGVDGLGEALALPPIRVLAGQVAGHLVSAGLGFAGAVPGHEETLAESGASLEKLHVPRV